MSVSYSAWTDWTRFHIIKTGQISHELSPETLASARIGNGMSDFSILFIAILNIVTGTTKLKEGLYFLSILPIGGIVLVPSAVFMWVRKTWGRHTDPVALGLILILSLFPSAAHIGRSSTALHYSIYAIFIFALVLYLLPWATDSNRRMVILFILIFTLFNLNHSIAHLPILFIPGVYIIGKLGKNTFGINANNYYISITTVLAIIAIFVLVDMQFNNRLRELAVQNFRLYFGQPPARTVLATTRFSQNIQSYTTLGNIARVIRGTALIIYRSIYLFYIIIFCLLIFNNLFKNILNFIWFQSSTGNSKPGVNGDVLGQYLKTTTSSDEEPEMMPYMYIFYYILLFPVVLLTYYQYGGIGGGVVRTQAVGIFVAIPVFAYFLNSKEWLERVTSSAIVLIVVLALIAYAFQTGFIVSLSSNREQETLIQSEESAIEFVGTEVPNHKYVFSDARLGPPLVYYNQMSLVMITKFHNGWRSLLKAVYYNSRKTPSSAIMNASRQSQVRVDHSHRGISENIYLLSSDRTSQLGVSLLDFRTQPPPSQEFNEQYNSHHRVYDSGPSQLFMLNMRVPS